MPKLPINYQNCVIYKICCDDIDDFYIGSTTDFKSRKRHHKSACTKEGDKKYNYKLYKTIRANGGWENWRMVEVERYPCNDKREAHMREEQLRMALKATLNMCRAWGNDKKCSVDGCEKYSKKNGVCLIHGAVLKRCSIEGCNKYPIKGGVCITHGAALKRCSIEGCDKQAQKGGVCAKHGPKYTCEVCNKVLSTFCKSQHEKTKTHLENLN